MGTLRLLPPALARGRPRHGAAAASGCHKHRTDPKPRGRRPAHVGKAAASEGTGDRHSPRGGRDPTPPTPGPGRVPSGKRPGAGNMPAFRDVPGMGAVSPEPWLCSLLRWDASRPPWAGGGQPAPARPRGAEGCPPRGPRRLAGLCTALHPHFLPCRRRPWGQHDPLPYGRTLGAGHVGPTRPHSRGGDRPGGQSGTPGHSAGPWEPHGREAEPVASEGS